MNNQVILSICSIIFASLVSALEPWTIDSFPNPSTSPAECGRKGVSRSFICDPDGLLSPSSKDIIEGIINMIGEHAIPYAKSPCSEEGFQVAVATMRKMAIPSGANPSDAAASFARALHNNWGVGHGHSCNDGAVFLLSLDDRQMFVSTGLDSGRLLTDSVLDSIFSQIKPLLRDGAYDAAVERAVLLIGQGLAGNPVKEKESVDYVGLAIFGVFLLLVPIILIASYRQTAAKRLAFKTCQQRLDEIKRLSEALQGGDGGQSVAYNPQTCPICFEDFSPIPPTELSPLITKERELEPSAPPLEESTGDKEPLLLRSASSLSAPAALSVTNSESKSKSRKPLILPCQHQFCENCIEAWVKQQKTSCPVCRKPMDGKSDAPPPPPPPPPSPGPHYQHHYHYHPSLHTHSAWMRARQREELMYRIDRLRHRYPAYVSESMVERARDDISQGRQVSSSVYTDLQLNDPATRQALASSGSRGSSMSFGGGRSSGGRGSSW